MSHPSKLTITTPPSGSLLALADVKAYLRIDADATHEDAVISDMMEAAVIIAERITGRALLQTVFKLDVDGFRDIELPKPPLVSMDSITYIDEAGDQQPLPADQYRLRDEREPAFVEFIGTDLPKLNADAVHPISINYTAGYADASAVPAPIKQYAKMLVADNFDLQRGTTTMLKLAHSPLADSLIMPYIVTEL